MGLAERMDIECQRFHERGVDVSGVKGPFMETISVRISPGREIPTRCRCESEAVDIVMMGQEAVLCTACVLMYI